MSAADSVPAHPPGLKILPATPADTGVILRLIRELADYEKLLHEVVATEELLHKALFAPGASAECRLAWLNGKPVGFALFCHNISTFLGRHGLYLEDLYVQPEHRGAGVGGALLRHLARIAVQRGCGRMEWAALDWNKRAIQFYERVGAVAKTEWITFRLSGDELLKLGS